MTVTLTATPDLEALPTERLEAELCEFAAHLDAGLSRWLTLLAEYDRRSGFDAWECRSAAQWLSWKCGISPVTAWEYIRVARKLRQLPAMSTAFAAGTLSYSKVRCLTRLATPESEQEFIEMAGFTTAAQLEQI